MINFEVYSRFHLREIESDLTPKGINYHHTLTCLVGHINKSIQNPISAAIKKLGPILGEIYALYTDYNHRFYNSFGYYPNGRFPENFAVNRKTGYSIVKQLYRENIFLNTKMEQSRKLIPPETGWLTTQNIIRNLNDMLKIRIIFLFSESLKEFGDEIECAFKPLLSKKNDTKEDGPHHSRYLYFRIPTGCDEVGFEIELINSIQYSWRMIRAGLMGKYKVGENVQIDQYFSQWRQHIGGNINMVNEQIKTIIKFMEMLEKDDNKYKKKNI